MTMTYVMMTQRRTGLKGQHIYYVSYIHCA